MQLLGGFPGEQSLCLLTQLQTVLFRNGDGLLAGAGIGDCGAGGDHIQGVAQNVGKHDGEYLCRSTALGKPAALDGGEPLADGVDLHDTGTAGQQLAGNVLQLFPGDQGLFKQGAAAAGQQEQHGILFSQVGNQVQGLLGTGEGIFIGDGMACFAAGEIGDGAHDVVILGDHNTALNTLAQTVIGGLSHLPGCLTGGYQQDSAGEFLALQGAGHGLIRQNCLDRSGYDGIRMSTQKLFHNV